VVIATRGRPELLRKAVRSILDQEYDGHLEVIVVFDHIDIDQLDDVAVPPCREIALLNNERAQGLAGGRNTGIGAATHGIIAFCDDDDSWESSKLRKQVELLEERPDASIVAAGIRIESEGGTTVRLPPPEVTFEELLRSRVTELHPSGFLARTDRFRRELQGIDEQIPTSFGEDYDLLLRAARFGPVVSVTEPLVIVNWDRPSFFTMRWRGIAEGLEYILRKHPEFAECPTGYARIAGQIAFARAAMGDRAIARRWARDALRHDRRQLRAYGAYAVSFRLVSPSWLVATANRRGHGL
jgi:glycosyltransferase involved in cell wall biosynthesis